MKTLVLLLGLLLFGVAEGAEPVVKLSPEQIAHLGIRTAQPEPVSALPLARAPGRVVLPPGREFVVSTLQSGVVNRVNVPQGVRVKKGQALAEIRSPAFLDVQKTLLDAASVLNVAQVKLHRDQVLLKEGVISQLRWQETKSDFDKAQATLKAAEQTLLASGMTAAEVERLKATRHIDSLLEVYAPTDGVVLERLATVGQRVDALAPLFRLGKLDQLWVEVDMPQERLHEIKLGDRVVVENPKATARIIEVSQNVDPASQTALVRAVVEAGALQLRPGMQINVQLMHRSTDHIVRVPSEAVFSHQGQNYVFVKTADGFAAREVRVAGEEPYRVTIHEGLNPGDSVVVQGVAALKAAWLGTGVDP